MLDCCLLFLRTLSVPSWGLEVLCSLLELGMTLAMMGIFTPWQLEVIMSQDFHHSWEGGVKGLQAHMYLMNWAL